MEDHLRILASLRSLPSFSSEGSAFPLDYFRKTTAFKTANLTPHDETSTK